MEEFKNNFNKIIEDSSIENQSKCEFILENMIFISKFKGDSTTQCIKIIMEYNYNKFNDIIAELCCENGYIYFLKQMHNGGINLNTISSFYKSSFSNNFECLRFLHDSYGCQKFINDPIEGSNIIEAAVFNDNIECLIFLIENKYPTNDDIIQFAKNTNSSKCFEYLLENKDLLSIVDPYKLVRQDGFDITNAHDRNITKDFFSKMFIK